MARGRCTVGDFTSNAIGESEMGYIPDTTMALYDVFKALVWKRLFDTNPIVKRAIGPNVVLVFSANAALSDKVVDSVCCVLNHGCQGCLIPSVPASNVAQADEIRSGRKRAFSGRSQFKTLLWITFPLLTCLHFGIICWSCSIKRLLRGEFEESVDSERGEFEHQPSWRKQMVSYFQIEDIDYLNEHCSYTRTLKQAVKPCIGICTLAVPLVVLNVCSPRVYTGPCIPDPLLILTTAVIDAANSNGYQWMFTVCAGTMTAVTCFFARHIRDVCHTRKAEAERVLNLIMGLVTGSMSPTQRAVDVWRSQAISGLAPSVLRRLAFYFVHFPVVGALSLPTGCCNGLNWN